MSIFKVLLYPDPVLKKKARPVEKFDDELRRWADKMLATMYEYQGIGLASVQVGDLRRAFVMDVPYNETEQDATADSREDGGNEKDACRNDGKEMPASDKQEAEEKPSNPLVLVNPRIVSAEGSVAYEEGCLSVPDVKEFIPRSAVVEVEYQDLDGAACRRRFEHLEAVCVQHEIDHLDGVLFFDRLPVIKRSIVKKKYLKAQKSAAGN